MNEGILGKGLKISRWDPPELRFRYYAVVNAESDCWEWSGRLTEGYGSMQVDGRNVMAHRWSYEHHVGPIADGLVVDHLCRNRRCVNPEHLEPVTQAENLRRGRISRGFAA